MSNLKMHQEEFVIVGSVPGDEWFSCGPISSILR